MAIQGSAADVTHYLKGIDFPCEKQDLIKHAEKNNADNEVISSLKNLPEGKFETMADVMKAFGKSH